MHVSRRLLDDEDGPMLELLKRFRRQPLLVPMRRAARPDPALLAIRFELFQRVA